MKKTTKTCAPCALSSIRRVNYGDKLLVKAGDAGFTVGQELEIYGYCKTPDGLNFYTVGNTPRQARDFNLYPAGTCTEIWFKVLPKYMSEIPAQTADEYLEYVPAATDLLQTDENGCYKLWPNGVQENQSSNPQAA